MANLLMVLALHPRSGEKGDFLDRESDDFAKIVGIAESWRESGDGVDWNPAYGRHSQQDRSPIRRVSGQCGAPSETGGPAAGAAGPGPQGRPRGRRGDPAEARKADGPGARRQADRPGVAVPGAVSAGRLGPA